MVWGDSEFFRIHAMQDMSVSHSATSSHPTTVLVGSSKDAASRNIVAAITQEHDFRSTGIELLGQPVYQKDSLLLATFEQEIIRPPDLDEYFNPQAYVFLSRHSAESGIPALTSHTAGNFSPESKFGGSGGELARADPFLLKNYMLSLAKRRERVAGYQVTIEATHHGPTSLQKPVLFVEVGATEKNWNDTAAARVVADSLIESLEERRTWEKTAIGFGGNHYPEKFTHLLLESDMAVSIIAPRYSLEHVDERMVAQMLQKTNTPVKYAALDWKGLGSHKERIMALVQQFGLEVVRL
jgi:D-aminoacyl-tRNA deacylase